MIENKYYKVYIRIVLSAKLRPVRRGQYQYYEKHHIMPKSLGGENTKENLVHLTPKEHYICHHLLTKCTEGKDKRKMVYAWLLMAKCDKTGNRYIPAIQYDFLRRELATVGKSSEHKTKIGEAHTGIKPKPFSEEAKKNMSEARRKDWAEGKYTNEHAKKPKSEETKQKMAEARRKWWSSRERKEQQVHQKSQDPEIFQ